MLEQVELMPERSTEQTALGIASDVANGLKLLLAHVEMIEDKINEIREEVFGNGHGTLKSRIVFNEVNLKRIEDQILREVVRRETMQLEEQKNNSRIWLAFLGAALTLGVGLVLAFVRMGN